MPSAARVVADELAVLRRCSADTLFLDAVAKRKELCSLLKLEQISGFRIRIDR